MPGMPFIQIQNYIANKVVLEIIGFTLDLIGKVLMGVAVYFVHKRIMKEEKIDKMVLKKRKKDSGFRYYFNNDRIFNAITS